MRDMSSLKGHGFSRTSGAWTATSIRHPIHTKHLPFRSILSDLKTYPNPDVFDPERFLGEDQQLDPREACFGWGRRVCPGARLVDSVVFIYVAVTLATLDVSRCVESGVEWVPRYDFEEGMIRCVSGVVLVCRC